MPGAWTEHLPDDELWAAVEVCDPWRDPFALLGALDIALCRQHDERYRTFAEAAVEKLVRETFPRPDGIDIYELLPLWAELILNRLNTLEGGALRPPFWKRMCAWMQAGFLASLTQRLTLDLDSFRAWAGGNQTTAGIYAKIVDLRHEPMYRAAEMSRRAFSEEVVGRLVLVRDRHKAAGRPVQGTDKIDEAVRRLAEHGSPLGWALPGPLDGHCRPAEIGVRLSADDSKKCEEELTNNPTASVLSTLAYIAQRFDLGEKLLARMRETIAHSTFDGAEPDLEEHIGRLTYAGFIAAAQRDGELADTIASAVVATAHQAQLDCDVESILQALLVAGAAWQNEDEWARWLEERVAEVALCLPVGEQSKMFLAYLQELKQVLKLHLGIHVRAEALASAAS
jgi:uncharacterized membrane protein YebE (DUF533 family)